MTKSAGDVRTPGMAKHTSCAGVFVLESFEYAAEMPLVMPAPTMMRTHQCCCSGLFKLWSRVAYPYGLDNVIDIRQGLFFEEDFHYWPMQQCHSAACTKVYARDEGVGIHCDGAA